MTLLEGALSAQERGLSVFRLQPKSKHPYAGSHGCLDATRDFDQIKRWWAEKPNSNIGVGGLGDNVIVDCDAGCNSLMDALGFLDSHGLPPTLTIHTGRADAYGFQAHYSGSTDYLEYKDIRYHGELRCKSRYGIFPPSIHVDTGRHYEICVDSVVAPWQEEYRTKFLDGHVEREIRFFDGGKDIVYSLESARESYYRRLFAARNAVKGGRNFAGNSVAWFASRAVLAQVFDEYEVCGVLVLPRISTEEVRQQITDAVAPLYKGDRRNWKQMLRDSWRYGVEHGPLQLNLTHDDYFKLQTISDDIFQEAWDGRIEYFNGDVVAAKGYMARCLIEAGIKDIQRVLNVSGIMDAVAKEVLFDLQVGEIIRGREKQ